MPTKISGVVKGVSSITTQKEGKDGAIKEDMKKKIRIEGVGNDEGIVVNIITTGDADEVFCRLMEDITITIQAPQQRLPVEEDTKREVVEEDDEEDED